MPTVCPKHNDPLSACDTYCVPKTRWTSPHLWCLPCTQSIIIVPACDAYYVSKEWWALLFPDLRGMFIGSRLSSTSLPIRIVRDFDYAIQIFLNLWDRSVERGMLYESQLYSLRKIIKLWYLKYYCWIMSGQGNYKIAGGKKYYPNLKGLDVVLCQRSANCS